MSEQQPRIPEIDLDQFGPQDVQVVDESYIGLDPDIKPETALWVHRYDSVQRLRELNAPAKILRDSEALFSKEKLLKAGNEVLGNPQAAHAFNNLITTYAHETGQLEEIVDALKPSFSDANKRLLVAILGDSPYRQGDTYGFSNILLDKSAPQKDRIHLVALHSEALKAAESQLQEQLPKLMESFDQRLQTVVARGILPESALPDKTSESSRALRIKNVSVLASDAVTNSFNEKGGHYEPSNNVIQLDASDILEGRPWAEKVYTHEMMHVHSGVTVRLDRQPLMTEEDFDPDEFEPWMADPTPETHVSGDYWNNPNDANAILVAPRVGLSHGQNFFNEAFTEWATQQLLGNEYDQAELWTRFIHGESEKDLTTDFQGTYIAERAMLAGLAVHGIDMLTIGKAYFESYEPKMNNPHREPRNTVPARRKLDAAIAEQTPYNSLAQIERVLEAEVMQRHPEAKERERSWLIAELLAEKLGDLPIAA